MYQSLSLLAYSDLGLLLAVIGVYVFFAALWLVYVTTERTAKGSMETEKRIERMRHETVQEIANARAIQMNATANASNNASISAIKRLQSELATVRDIAKVNAEKLASVTAQCDELTAQLDAQSSAHASTLESMIESMLESHLAEYHDDNVVASFELESNVAETAVMMHDSSDQELFEAESPEVVEEEAPPVFKLFSPSDEIESQEIAIDSDMSAHDDELGLVFCKRPAAPDDLTRIWGVGATNQDLLNENGVFFFHQVAAWTEQNIAKFNDILCFRGRIEREDWVGQAQRLASGDSTAIRNAA